uniref:Non-SMC condensin II complex, subunit D3 n=1 Tax=Cyprinodon variegatus TaxID=28743 RepID=A0A3Q2DUI6_CYPVA
VIYLRGTSSAVLSSPDWVDAVWDLEFTERQPLDAMMEDELAAAGEKSFRTLYRCLMEQAAEQQRSSGQEGVSQVSWTPFGVSVKSLVAVLSHFILTAKAKEGGVQQRVCGLYAASVYLLLLGVPGSIANKVFHEVLLDTCSDLPSHCWPQEHGRKRKKDALKASQADGKRSKPQRRDAMEMDLEEEEEEEEQHFSGQDLMKIRDAIALLVQSLLRLLQTFPLKDRTQSASNCTQVNPPTLHLSSDLVWFLHRDLSELKSIPEMAFYGLKLLCSPKHGDQKEVGLHRDGFQMFFLDYIASRGGFSFSTSFTVTCCVFHVLCSHLVEELKDLALPLLQILLQHICFQMVEKSEYRSHGAQAVGMLTSQMVSVDYACFIKWLFSFSSHSKMVHRLFSVDVVMVLLAQPERSVEDCPDPELARFLPQKFLIQEVLFARRNDESPTVQGHALSCLAQCLELPSLNVTRASANSVLEGHCPAGFRGFSAPAQLILIGTKENLALLLRRVGDPKTNVRKAALQALVGLLKHGVIPATWENLESLSERSRDPAVSVRKKALQCLGELLAAKPSCRAVQKAWLHCVVPAVMDTESSMQEKALELLDQVLLSQVKPYNERSLLDHSQSLTWDLLGLLCDESQNLSRYFSRAFSIWSKQNKFSPAFISSLVSHTQTDHAAGAWLLLSKAVSSVSRVPHGQILDAWDTMIRSDSVNVTSCCHILSVVGDVAAHLNEDTKEPDLMSRLKTFRLPLEVISAAMDTLYQLGCSEDIRLTQVGQRYGLSPPRSNPS